jgi:hypothetical protein
MSELKRWLDRYAEPIGAPEPDAVVEFGRAFEAMAHHPPGVPATYAEYMAEVREQEARDRAKFMGTER